jgi:hypothetical protein
VNPSDTYVCRYSPGQYTPVNNMDQSYPALSNEHLLAHVYSFTYVMLFTFVLVRQVHQMETRTLGTWQGEHITPWVEHIHPM